MHVHAEHATPQETYGSLNTHPPLVSHAPDYLEWVDGLKSVQFPESRLHEDEDTRTTNPGAGKAGRRKKWSQSYSDMEAERK